jgi:hypothetical protein
MEATDSMNNSTDYLLMCGCVGDFPPFLLLRGRFRGNTRDKSLSSQNALRKRVSGKIAWNVFAMLTPRHVGGCKCLIHERTDDDFDAPMRNSLSPFYSFREERI